MYKIIITFSVIVALLIAYRMLAPSSACVPLGFGDPLSHTDTPAPEKHRQMLESKAVLAAQQAATIKKFNTDNFIA
jgi:hypothetical protein